jgi:N-acetylglucosamine-6-phosphate deacetylase
MITRIKSENIILRDGISGGFVYFEGGKIRAVTREELPFDEEIDATDRYVSPGFIDLHTHGAGGYNFSESTASVINAANTHLTHGTTSLLPTLSAAPIKSMARATEYIKEAMQDAATLPNILGAHLEGPYFNPEYCGAQKTEFITPPIREDYEPLLEKYSDVIARVSYAPELDTDNEFLSELKKHGILASAGHTGARYSDMDRAIGGGLSLITHLYSCTSTVTREFGFRHPGVIETAFLRDDIYAEIIADGKHLPFALIRLVVKVKGADKVALITDSLCVAGLDTDGGKFDNPNFIIEDGVCKLPDRSAFAGSICTADRCVREVYHGAGFPLFEAVKMMSAIPAEILGIKKGRLEADYDADIVIFDENISVELAIVGGEKKYER